MKENLPPIDHASEYCLALSRLLTRTSNPKLGLERVEKLLDLVGFDRSAMRIIQVVGTNGKGSTSAFIEAILRSARVSCGLFTSPHLCTARERIRINGMMISHEDFIRAAECVLSAAALLDDEASFFECMLAIAMWIFQQHHVAVAIMEAGLGGRLDATTAVKADILGITSIDFDHQNILGTTLAAIATEKIAAARRNQIVFTVSQVPEAMDAMQRGAQEIGCDLRHATATTMPLGLFGAHQQTNAGLARALVDALAINVSATEISHGLLNVNWPGRFELVKDIVPLVLDGAHNPAGIDVLVNALKCHEQFAGTPLVMVYGSLAGDNTLAKIAVLKASGLATEHIFLHESHNQRALAQEHLRDAFIHCGFDHTKITMFESMAQVKKRATDRGASVVVCGSLYTVGEIRSELFGIARDFETPHF